MKTYKLIVAGMLGLALSVMPVFAQRGGGNRGGGGHSTSVSRSSGGFSGSSRSSSSFSGSSRSSSSYSSSSRSSSYSAPRSSSSSRSSYSAPRSSSHSSYSNSRSNSSYSSPRSSSVNHSSAYRGNSFSNSRSSATSASRSTHSSPISRSAAMANSSSRGNSSISANRGGAPSRSSVTGTRSGVNTSRGNSSLNNSRGNSSVTNSRGNSGITNTRSNSLAKGGRPGVDNGRPSGSPNRPLVNGDSYARPGHPGVLPPSAVPLHPAPYFYCPYYDAVLYMNLVPWYAPVVVRPIYWPGFWIYCNSYWYDYHPTDVIVVREYVDKTYGVDLIAYAISGDYMYALVNDNDGYTYLQVFDQNDRLLAEQQVHRKYRDMSIDRENGGCWISKKNGKDPLLFFYTDGQLLIYETD